jgi:hypothetical protein
MYACSCQTKNDAPIIFFFFLFWWKGNFAFSKRKIEKSTIYHGNTISTSNNIIVYFFFNSKLESPIAHEWYRENIKHAMTRYLNELSHFSMSVNKNKQVKKNQKLSFKSYALVSFFMLTSAYKITRWYYIKFLA